MQPQKLYSRLTSMIGGACGLADNGSDFWKGLPTHD